MKDQATASEPNIRGRLLKLENNPHTLDFIGDGLQARGYQLLRASGTQAALKLAEAAPPELVLVVHNPARQVDAVVWLSLHHTHPNPQIAMMPLLILAQEADLGDLAIDAQPGRVALLPLPVNLDVLEETIDALLRPWGGLNPAP